MGFLHFATFAFLAELSHSQDKIITDENCEHDEKGRIKVDWRNGWKYRGTSTTTGGERTGGTPGECKAPCTTGNASYPPYCYLKNGGWDYCVCAKGKAALSLSR